jgi:hypothetical protein
MAKIQHCPPYTLNLTDAEFLLIFHLLREIHECLEGYYWGIPKKVTSMVELTFDVEYGIFDTCINLLEKVDTELMREAV